MNEEYLDLDKLVAEGKMKKEFKEQEIYIKMEDGAISKVKKNCWFYETLSEGSFVFKVNYIRH